MMRDELISLIVSAIRSGMIAGHVIGPDDNPAAIMIDCWELSPSELSDAGDTLLTGAVYSGD